MSNSVSLMAPTEEFIQVPTCILRAIDKTCVDLFLQHDDCAAPIFYRDAGYPLSEDPREGTS